MYTSKIHNWNLMTNVMVLRGEGFGRWLVYEGGAFLNGISALTKKLQRAPLLLLSCKYTMRSGLLQPRRGHSLEPNYTGIQILDFQPPEL